MRKALDLELQEFSKLKLEDIPAELLEDVRSSTAESAWEKDARAYLSKMLAEARITYYAIPEGAAYDVDVSGVANGEREEESYED